MEIYQQTANQSSSRVDVGTLQDRVNQVSEVKNEMICLNRIHQFHVPFSMGDYTFRNLEEHLKNKHLIQKTIGK